MAEQEQQDPFGQLVSDLELPPVPRSSTEIVQPVSAGMIAESAVEDLKLTLDSEAADLHGNAVFQLLPDPENSRWWKVVDAGGGRSLEIARFFVDGQLRLQFQWLAAVSTVANQLRNSLLTVRSGPHQHTIALRRPVYQDGLTLLLNRRDIVSPVQLQELPQKDKTFLEVTNLHNLRVPVNFIPDSRKVPLGIQGSPSRSTSNRLKIQVGKAKLVELEVQIREKGDDEVELAVRPVYLRKGQKGRISRPSLTKMFSRELRGNEIKFVREWRDYLAAWNRKPTLEAEIQTIRGQLVAAQNTVIRSPTNVNAQAQANRLQGLFDAKRGQLDKCNGTIERWRKQLPESSASLGRQRQIEVIGMLVHDVAHLEFRIVAKGKSADIPLLVASSEPPPVPPEIQKIDEEIDPAGVWVDATQGNIYELAGGGDGGDGTFRVLPPNFNQSQVINQGTWRMNQETVTLNGPVAIETYKANENFELKSTTTSLYRVFGVKPSTFRVQQAAAPIPARAAVGGPNPAALPGGIPRRP